MKYRFILKGYFEVSHFDVIVKRELDLNSYKYIRFSSYENAKITFDFYKLDVCQGNKPSPGTIMADTGFFKLGYKHWTEFDSFNKRIVYQFQIKENGIIELEIIPVKESYDLDKSLILDL
jgi:hypothetical protein